MLRYAVERLLYIDLVNNEGLYELFRESRLGRPRNRLELDTAIERDVARLTCGAAGGRRVKPPALSLSERVVGKLRAMRHASAASLPAEAVAAPPAPPGPDAPVCVLLHHPKFFRFAQPVLGLLPPDTVAVLATDSEFREQVESSGLRFVSLEGRMGSGVAENVDVGLAEHPYLPRVFDSLAAELARLGARCVVVVEGTHPLDEVANQVCKLLDIPCVCLQQGWSPIAHNGFRNMSFSSMFVWGEGFAELLAPYNPEQAFVATGSPVLAGAVAGSDGLRATLKGRKAVTFFLQTTSRLIAHDHLEEMSALIRETLRRFPDVQVLVRHHPGVGERLEGLDDTGIVLVPPASYGLHEVLALSSAAVSIYSTTLLEAAALLVPPIAYNMTSLPRYLPDLEAAGAGIEVREREAALAAIERLIGDDDYRDGFVPGMTAIRERFFAGGDGHAAERIAAEIADRAKLSIRTGGQRAGLAAPQHRSG